MAIYFYKGNANVFENEKNADDSEDKRLLKIQKDFSTVLDGKNLSFLLGCGCSSYLITSEQSDSEIILKEVGVPTMVSLALEFYGNILLESEVKWLNDHLKIDIQGKKFKNNIEFFLGALYNLFSFYESTGQVQKDDNGNINEEISKDEAVKLYQIIKKARNFMVQQCLNEKSRNDELDKDLIDLYKKFYRKLLYRPSNLNKPNIFTTNYDLYSEIALDDLGIHYVNGFSGGIKKYFNPTIFNYALAEKMDLSQSKWSVIDNFVYLYKIHGSLNWIQDNDESKLFGVREIQEAKFEVLENKEVIMIYPTPLKQNSSMGSPYSDLFREFQKKLMQNNNILVSIGYSFKDEHINNLIYQAFTIPSFRLIILGDNQLSDEIKKLQLLDDPRIWIIGGILENESSKNENLHYFKGFVNHILPDLSNEQIDQSIEKAIKTLIHKGE